MCVSKYFSTTNYQKILFLGISSRPVVPHCPYSNLISGIYFHTFLNKFHPKQMRITQVIVFQRKKCYTHFHLFKVFHTKYNTTFPTFSIIVDFVTTMLNMCAWVCVCVCVKMIFNYQLSKFHFFYYFQTISSTSPILELNLRNLIPRILKQISS